MASTRSGTTPADQAGFALIEVLVSGVIAVIAAGAVFALMQATTRSAANERFHSQAYGIAQEDQVRLRSLRTPTLKTLDTSRPVVLDGTTFTVRSIAKIVNNVTDETPTCSTESASPDYAKIASIVTWPNMRGAAPTVIRSIVAPPRNSLDPDLGTLVITTTNAAGGPISGIGLSGSGAGTFSGSTNTQGCRIFSDIPAGEYTLKLSGFATGLVDSAGVAPADQKIGVIGAATNSVELQYDQPGIAQVSFKTANYSGQTNPIAAKASAMYLFHSGMKVPAKKFTVGTAATSMSTTKTLFPFTTPYAVYAGACTTNNPTGESTIDPADAEAMGSVTVPVNGTGTGTVKLPALLLTVKNSGGSGINGAKVTVADPACAASARTYTTSTVGSTGRLSETGLPWGTYNICASASISSTTRREKLTAVDIHNDDGTTVNISLTTGDEAGSC